MKEKTFVIKFYHGGDFKNNKYVGGEVFEFPPYEDADLISFTSLMSDVKHELKYTEIGGMYVKADDKRGFKLLVNDKDVISYMEKVGDSGTLEFFIDNMVDQTSTVVKQTQPFVLVRPRKLPTEEVPLRKSPRSKGEKCKFVTLKSIQQETSARKQAKKKELERKKELMQVEVSLVDEKIGDSDDVEGDANVEHEEDLPHDKESIIQLDNAYEQLRNENIAKNKDKIASLRMDSLSSSMRNSINQNAESKQGKKARKKKVTSNLNITRRTTRSLALAIDAAAKKTVKDVTTEGCARKRVAIETTEEPMVEVSEGCAEKLDIMHLRKKRDEGIGTMENYIALRKRQEKTPNQPQIGLVELPTEMTQIENDIIVQCESQLSHDSRASTKQPKRKFRGQTKLDAIHTRNIEERKMIMLNDVNQPIGDDKTLSEFSNFLGTLGRQYIKFSHTNWSHVPDKEILWQFVKIGKQTR
ncbi:uncharacterized protein [Euphorbia lathyris]|uniref:uncharacterized protein isoform X3 n=1 Tax=Euphorbia lathyris TaxID=212925 RepID=UPI00331436D6